MSPTPSPRWRALEVLLQADPTSKAAQAQALFEWACLASLDDIFTLTESDEALSGVATSVHDWRSDVISLSAEQLASMPGRPARPALVSAKEVPSRSPFTLDGRAALLHAICHIEFNAINLALDAVWRFADMPAAYYTDWLRVASEEAMHFNLLRAHLQTMGFDYGDFAAHDGLWHMCEKTCNDVMARMALVPRTLEARGLDATPLIQEKLQRAGDHESVAILDIILRDEVGHVAIGNRWFHHLCAARGLDALALYPQLVTQYDAPRMRPPFNEAARKAAGFTDAEMAYLLGMD
jgi:uncharacterized ferritin-like protein (DUF455 family)